MSAGVEVRDRDAMRGMIDAVVDRFGRLDVKFNNAGVDKPRNFLDVTDENWNYIISVDRLGCLIGMQETARQMIAQDDGRDRIVDTASIASRQGFDNVAPYCASKWAVMSRTQSVARDLAEHDITVTGFAPGLCDRDMGGGRSRPDGDRRVGASWPGEGGIRRGYPEGKAGSPTRPTSP